MAEIIITDSDRAAAEAFMEEILTELFPDADFSPGSVTRDHTIGALGAMVAYLRGEARRVRLATSLRTIPQLEDAADRSQAVDNLVANWFLSRREGTHVRGVVTIHFSRAHDGSIPATATFTRSAGVRFRLDSTASWTYGASNLSPRTDATGAVVDYTLRVPVIAENPGTAYEIEPGIFAGFTRFNAHTTFVENETAFTGATDVETPEELLARAPEAISVRDLNSARSINAVLREQFPEIDRVVTLGMRDPGMRRDVLELFAPEVIIHLGGYIDAYGSTPIVEKRVFEGVVGGTYTDARVAVTLFRDDGITDWRDHDVAVGDVILHENAGANEPTTYTVLEVTKHYLRVSSQQTFPDVRPVLERAARVFDDGDVDGGAETLTSPDALFTDDDVGRWIRVSNSGEGNDGDHRITSVDVNTSTATLDGDLSTESDVEFVILTNVVRYSIGDVGPSYANKVPLRTTGRFTRDFQDVGRVLLPQEPIYAIREVSILDETDSDADPITGAVTFPNRVNVQPTAQSGDDLQYRVEVKNPLEVNSERQMVTLDLGFAPEAAGANGAFNGSDEFVAPSASFVDPDDVGKRIRVLDAVTASNRGEFEITAVNSGTSVTVVDPDDGDWGSVAEGGLSWQLTNQHKYDGKTVRVTYDTALSFGAISAYVSNRDRRVQCADTLFRGFHAVYVSFNMKYRVRANLVQVPTSAEIQRHLVDFINGFPADEVLHASDIVSAAHEGFPGQVDSVTLPLVVNYELLAPDGRVIPYVTTDAVRLDPTKLASASAHDRLEEPATVGVTDENVRYLTTVDHITLTLVT